MFNRGQLHNTSFTYHDRYGSEDEHNGFFLSKMVNGRPSDGSFSTEFYSDRCTRHVDSLEKKSEVFGW